MSQGNSYNNIVDFSVRVIPADLATVQQQVAAAATAGLAQALAGAGRGGAPSASPRGGVGPGPQLAQIRNAAAGGSPSPGGGAATTAFSAAVSQFVAAVNRFASGGAGRRGGGGTGTSAAAQARAARLAQTGSGISPLSLAQVRRRNIEADREQRRQQREEATQPKGFLGRIAKNFFGRYGSITPVGRMLGLRRGGQMTEVLRSLSRGGGGRGGYAAAGAALGAMGGGIGGAGAGALAGAAGGPVGLAITAAVVSIKAFAGAMDAMVAKFGRWNAATAKALAYQEVSGVQNTLRASQALGPAMTNWVNMKTTIAKIGTDILVAISPLINGVSKIFTWIEKIYYALPGTGHKGDQDAEMAKRTRSLIGAGADQAFGNAGAGNRLLGRGGNLGANDFFINKLARQQHIMANRRGVGGMPMNARGRGGGAFAGRPAGGDAMMGFGAAGAAGAGGMFAPGGLAGGLGKHGGGGIGGFGGNGQREHHAHFFLDPRFENLQAWAMRFHRPKSGVRPSGNKKATFTGNIKALEAPKWDIGQATDFRHLNDLKVQNDALGQQFAFNQPLDPQVKIQQDFQIQLQNENQTHAAVERLRSYVDEGMRRLLDETKLRLGMNGLSFLSHI